MKIKEKAREDLEEILQQMEQYTYANLDSMLAGIVGYMRHRGWESVSMENILETARTLGFPVVGNRIYRLEE